MAEKFNTRDWIRILIGFVLGVAVTLLVLQLSSGGSLFQGALLPGAYSTTTSTTLKATDTKLSIPPGMKSGDIRESIPPEI